MNKKKKEQKRKARGLLTASEHWERTKHRRTVQYQKNPKNKNRKLYEDWE